MRRIAQEQTMPCVGVGGTRCAASSVCSGRAGALGFFLDVSEQERLILICFEVQVILMPSAMSYVSSRKDRPVLLGGIVLGLKGGRGMQDMNVRVIRVPCSMV